ncbi:MAG: glycosyltransferase family 4 protein, partial [Ignisphaera sp.]
MSSPKMTILWHSVAPHIRSGYGKVTKYVTTGLAKHGYRIVVSAYYGVEPGGVLNFENVMVVGSKEGPFGVDSAAKFARLFNTDIQILHTDWWAFSKFPQLVPYPVLYGPMDHIYYPEEIISFTRMYKRIISLCYFQQKELKERWGIDSDVIYHGVDISIFKPMNKEYCKELLGLKDKFVFGTVAANSDKEDRKSWAPMIKAFKHFLDQHPDARKDIKWVCHTVPNDPRGLPLSSIVHKWGLDDIVRFMDPSIADVMITEEQLAHLYNAMDVHILCSKREGFGIPILESMACGVPNICHNFSSMPELVKGRGWLVKSLGADLNLETTPINAETA